MSLEIGSSSAEDTLRIAGIVGRNLAGGETIELIGDLGAGKTVFVRGLASGIESSDVVQSPSFTITRLYKGKNNLEIHHFDFHRLEEPGIVAGELEEATKNPKAVTVVEWSDIVQHVLPNSRLTVNISSTKNPAARMLKFEATDKNHQKLLEGLQNDFSH